MVVFVHAVPRKSAYRRFNIRSVQGQDDYASMREVLQRRFRRWQMATSASPLVGGIEGGGKRDIKGWAKLPDLLIVDGGKGQLGVAVEVLKEFDLFGQVPVAGLAKQREEIFLPGRPRPVLLPDALRGCSSCSACEMRRIALPSRTTAHAGAGRGSPRNWIASPVWGRRGARRFSKPLALSMVSARPASSNWPPCLVSPAPSPWLSRSICSRRQTGRLVGW